MNPLGATASEIAEAVRNGRINAIEVAEAFLDRIDALDRTIGAFLSVDRMGALAAARTVDRKVSTGGDPGKLAGIPVAVKDNLCTAGLATTAGSRILSGFIPSYDAHVVERLRAEGAVILGKTNLDEFAMGSSCENSALGRTVNPHDPKRVPGGSSGGSAAAVAAGLVPLALGSDTGGSIRQPAALCGVVGLKPTYGRVSRYGLIAFGSSLDQVGPLARSAEDAALLLEAVAGHDPRDSTSADRRVEEYRAAARRGVQGLRIGVPKEYFPEGLDAEIAASARSAIAKMEALGARAVDLEMPHTRYAIPTYYIVATAEASSNLARYDGVHYGYRAPDPSDLCDLYTRSRTDGFGQEVKRRIMLGTFVLSSGYSDQYYVKALRVRRLIKEDFDRAFEKVDVVAGPTSPWVAFEFGAKVADPLQMYLCDVLTVAANLAGLPAISIPCGASAGGLPIGLQLQAPSFGEAMLFSLAGAFQAATDHHARRPEAFA